VRLASFTPLLDVASGHRTRVIQRFREDWSAGAQFLMRYARLDFVDEAGLFSDDWRIAALEIARTPTWSKGADPVTVVFALRTGVLDADEAASLVTDESLLRIKVEGRSGPGPFWWTLADPDPGNEARRMETWNQCLREIWHAKEIFFDAGDWYGPMLEAAPGVKSTKPPEELAVALALLTGPHWDFVTLDKTRCIEAVEFATVARSCQARVGELHREAHQVDLEAEAAKVRSRLNGAYRRYFGKSTPRWIRDWAGVGAKKRVLGWRDYPADLSELMPE
jgi:hypothetical protein